jgi:hypothetical protein
MGLRSGGIPVRLSIGRSSVCPLQNAHLTSVREFKWQSGIVLATSSICMSLSLGTLHYVLLGSAAPLKCFTLFRISKLRHLNRLTCASYIIVHLAVTLWFSAFRKDAGNAVFRSPHTSLHGILVQRVDTNPEHRNELRSLILYIVENRKFRNDGLVNFMHFQQRNFEI